MVVEIALSAIALALASLTCCAVALTRFVIERDAKARAWAEEQAKAIAAALIAQDEKDNEFPFTFRPTDGKAN